MKWPNTISLSSLSRHFRSLLRSCARQSSLSTGKKLHAIILTTGITNTSPKSYLPNTVLHMYASCGDLIAAHKLFDEIPNPHKDTVDWSVLMGCLSRQNMPFEAIRLFVKMRGCGVKPDDVGFVLLFAVCADLVNLEVGVQGHGCLVKMGFGVSVRACNALMDMYVKCGMVHEARRVFGAMEERSVVSWAVVLDGVIKWEGVDKGREVFDQMPERNEVAWTTMVVGYVESGFTRESLHLLCEMMFCWGFRLSVVSLTSFLPASARSGDVVIGKWVHVYALKTVGVDIDVMMGTALLDMYAKCGRISSALKVFECMPWRNVVAWNAIISGLAMHGHGRVALDMFPRMLEEVKPDDFTFTSLLNACSHAGLIDQGLRCFLDLQFEYGVTPKMEHYACMVDLLGRAGRIEDAERLVNTMPMPPNEVVLGALLGSCYAHGKLELGERILQRLLQFDPGNTEYHILLSNMYSQEGNLKEANALRHILKSRGIRKIPGISSIHVGGQFHRFSAGDKLHPRAKEIYNMLDEMIRKLRSAGYIPNSGASHVDVSADDDEEREQALFAHSEKLAVCFGLMSTKVGTPLFIFKNLRICHDCHSAMKLVSKIYERDIVIRDRSRFHKFRHGACSCSDYW